MFNRFNSHYTRRCRSKNKYYWLVDNFYFVSIAVAGFANSLETQTLVSNVVDIIDIGNSKQRE